MLMTYSKLDRKSYGTVDNFLFLFFRLLQQSELPEKDVFHYPSKSTAVYSYFIIFDEQLPDESGNPPGFSPKGKKRINCPFIGNSVVTV